MADTAIWEHAPLLSPERLATFARTAFGCTRGPHLLSIATSD